VRKLIVLILAVCLIGLVGVVLVDSSSNAKPSIRTVRHAQPAEPRAGLDNAYSYYGYADSLAQYEQQLAAFYSGIAEQEWYAGVQRALDEEAQRQAAARQTTAAPRVSSGPVDGDWLDRLAQCECGGNPSCNTGNGFYGTFQFMLGTWQSVGGQGLPSDATYEEQKYRAALLLERSSASSQFPGCTARLGSP